MFDGQSGRLVATVNLRAFVDCSEIVGHHSAKQPSLHHCDIDRYDSMRNVLTCANTRTATRSCRTRKRALHVYSSGVVAVRHVRAL